jgi:hypothetical protein
VRLEPIPVVVRGELPEEIESCRGKSLELHGPAQYRTRRALHLN